MDENSYSADVRPTSEVRARPADGNDFYLEWMTFDGTIMTVTTIKIRRNGLRKTIEALDEVRHLLREPTP